MWDPSSSPLEVGPSQGSDRLCSLPADSERLSPLPESSVDKLFLLVVQATVLGLLR